MSHIYFEVVVSGELKTTVTIRNLVTLAAVGGTQSVWAYEVSETHNKPMRGTVVYQGNNNLELIAKVLADHCAGTPTSVDKTPKTYREASDDPAV